MIVTYFYVISYYEKKSSEVVIVFPQAQIDRRREILKYRLPRIKNKNKKRKTFVETRNFQKQAHRRKVKTESKQITDDRNGKT